MPTLVPSWSRMRPSCVTWARMPFMGSGALRTATRTRLPRSGSASGPHLGALAGRVGSLAFRHRTARAGLDGHRHHRALGRLGEPRSGVFGLEVTEDVG